MIGYEALAAIRASARSNACPILRLATPAPEPLAGQDFAALEHGQPGRQRLSRRHDKSFAPDLERFHLTLPRNTG